MAFGRIRTVRFLLLVLALVITSAFAGTALEREYGFYVPYRFTLERRFVDLAPGLRFIPGALWLAGTHTAFWEDYLCYVLRGSGIFWQLKVVK